MNHYDYHAADEQYGIHEFVARYVRTDLHEADSAVDRHDDGRDRPVGFQL